RDDSSQQQSGGAVLEGSERRLPSSARRLVTLTGPGGSGKTRLALEVAQRLSERFGGAVWFVPLVDLADSRLIPDRLREAMHLPASPQVEPMEQVVTVLCR